MVALNSHGWLHGKMAGTNKDLGLPFKTGDVVTVHVSCSGAGAVWFAVNGGPPKQAILRLFGGARAPRPSRVHPVAYLIDKTAGTHEQEHVLLSVLDVTRLE